jgi:beta-aspartyl-peptidase (threonine type)
MLPPMKRSIPLFTAFAMTACLSLAMAEGNGSYSLALHGGAGALSPKKLNGERESAYRSTLLAALLAGERILKNGGSAMDAVQAVIVHLEDSPLFNAGRGSVFTYEGTNEMDASFMDGKSGDAGAVAGVTTIKNPIIAARRVMTHSPHVLLSGTGAERFAKEQKLQIVDPKYFHTEKRWKQLKKIQKRGQWEPHKSPFRYGTVGAVARDQRGNLAAGTSTGGMTNKRWGRIGDSPIIGAGTYAKNDGVAVSCTGHGEYFIREGAAHSVYLRMILAKQSVSDAIHTVIHEQIAKLGGTGGMIAVDKNGQIANTYNTQGMFRGWVIDGQAPVVRIWKH